MLFDLDMIFELEIIRLFPFLCHLWFCFCLTEKCKVEWSRLLDGFNYCLRGLNCTLDGDGLARCAKTERIFDLSWNCLFFVLIVEWKDLFFFLYCNTLNLHFLIILNDSFFSAIDYVSAHWIEQRVILLHFYALSCI